MPRARLPRRALWVAAAAAVVVHDPQDKLPIYPRTDPEIVLQETPSALEHQIGVARRAITNTYLDSHAQVQAVVSRWIGVEQAVERRVKSIIAPDEPLTPGLLYVGVATLTGSIVARNRFVVTRFLLPPALFFLSLNHFLPRTVHNLSAYFGSLEETYFPTFAQKHAVANAHTKMTWEMAKEKTKEGREKASESVASLIEKMQDTTGLKLREGLGLGREAVVQAQVAVEQKVEVAQEAIEQKANEVQAVTETKAAAAKEEVTRLA